MINPLFGVINVRRVTWTSPATQWITYSAKCAIVQMSGRSSGMPEFAHGYVLPHWLRVVKNKFLPNPRVSVSVPVRERHEGPW